MKINIFTNEKRFILFSNLFILIFLLALSIQGFDLTDEGYVLSSYQQIFSHPESVSNTFGIYFTCIVGGLINTLFGFGGWLAFRIANAVMLTAMFDVLFYTFKKFIKHYLLFFIGYVAILLLNSGILVFHYYTFSAFLMALFICLYYKGYETKSKWCFLFASTIVILSAFARFPCILFLFFPLFFPLFLYWIEKDNAMLRQRYLYDFLGIIFGITLVFAVLILCNHTDLYANSIQKLMTGNTNKSHSFSKLLLDDIRAYSLITLFTILLTVFIFNVRRIKNNKICIIILLVSALGMAFVSISKTVLFSICLPLYIVAIHNNKTNSDILVLSFLLVMSSLILPLGSAAGVSGMGGHALFALFPLGLSLFADITNEKINFKTTRYAFLLSVLMLLNYSIRIIPFAYRDEGLRINKTYRIKNSKYATIYTNETRGKEIDEMLKSINGYVNEGDSIICFPNIPGLHYLTNTVPATSNWTRSIPVNMFEEQLHSLESNNILPKAIIEHGKKSMTNSQEKSYHTLLCNFISRNKYKTIYCSENYRIFIANNK